MSGLKFILQSDQTDGANAVARVLPPRSGYILVRKHSLREVVADVIAKCGTDNRIQTIYLIGHGSPDGQEFGETTSDMLVPAAINAMLAEPPKLPAQFQPKGPPLPKPKHRHNGGSEDGVHLLHKLLPFYNLDGTAELILGGCRVGVGDTVKLMSKVMSNVIVSGFNMAQLPTGAGDAGVQVFYKNGICVKTQAHYTLTSVLSLLPSFAQASGIEQ